MTKHPLTLHRDAPPLDPAKFIDPDITATGERRARVGLERLETLWINTGTLCNITCVNCYIESSPTNDRLVYFPLADAVALFDEIAALGLGTREIGFTGGEPFMNPDILALLEAALGRGFEALVLTNAMQPMMRRRIREGLRALKARHGTRLTLRVSLDHHSRAGHEHERGEGTWETALAGLDWLASEGFSIAVCGRTCWSETEAEARAGYGRLFAERGYAIDADDPAGLVLLPEMDETADVPEITERCWGILGKSPGDTMCASSRMAVKRKGADRPVILPCTLLPYDPRFEMGETLRDALSADGGMFDRGRVKLNHPHCAKFCVLGGGSCSAGS
ncbi:radical SAM protein [Kaustia mangrovi]|uniref:Radical SAM protein n=1 Tax=Kaustia mangrovi TaxID=2593653 RepID=A0A7S8C4X0_9HYPH|nr:radical SAM protein [Kaustia mangrovi]QPC43451.1 radical SAM protein [Kaustia mangrovi]